MSVEDMVRKFHEASVALKEVTDAIEPNDNKISICNYSLQNIQLSEGIRLFADILGCQILDDYYVGAEYPFWSYFKLDGITYLQVGQTKEESLM